MIKLLSLFIPLLLLGSHLTAQNIILSELPTRDQLPSGQIYSVFEDSEGYMWYGTEEGLCRDDGYTIKIFRSDFHTPDLIKSNTVTCITEDKKRRIWFGTKRGVYILDKKGYHISPLSDDEIKGWSIANIICTSDSTIWVSSNNTILRYNIHGKRIGTYAPEWEGLPKKTEYFYEDTGFNTLWIVQWQGGIFRFDTEANRFVPYPWPFREPPTSIIKDKSGLFYWVTTWGKGVVRFDPSTKEADQMFVHQPLTMDPDNYLQGEDVKILQDNIRNYIWVISTDNLYAYNISPDNMLIPIDTSSFLSTEKKMLSNITSDRLGNLWISGYYPHSFIISFQEEHIEYDGVSVLKEMLKFPVSIDILIHDNGCFWCWPKRGGLCLYNPQTRHIEFSNLRKRKLSPFLEKSSLNNGVFCVLKEKIVLLLQYKENKIYDSEIVDITPVTDPGERIRTLHEDKSGYLWIGTSQNLFRYNQKTKELYKIWENTGIINDIISSDNHEIYLATEANGLLCLSRNNKKSSHKVNENCVNLTITPDREIWIGTQQGNIYRFTPQTHELISMAKECGLDGDVISIIEASSSGKVWIMTNNKITIFDPAKKTFNTIHASDPTVLMSNFNCLDKDENDNFYIGGTEGFLTCPALFQEKASETSQTSPLNLTAIKVNGQLKVFDYENEVIKLMPNERNVELFLSTFNPMNREKIHYAFKYKNDDSYWNYLLQGQNSIYLPQIPKGYNEIEVKATDKNGYWDNNIMTIRIYLSPKWYETWLAYSIYVILLIAIAFYLIHLYIKRQKDKNRIQMEERIAQMKFRFFTNISHELRTPLTLIITPLDTIIKKVSDADVKKQLGTVYKNAQSLLELVNQLLDFRKIEMGGETISLSRGDMKNILAVIHENFQSLAIQKKITFSFHCEPEAVYMNIDYKKIQKIVNNLLSNAFKFTEEAGKITLALEIETIDNRKYAIIKVEDTGAGIPENELGNIFERFHQVNDKKNNGGTGIGLHLVKEYTEMHQGRITVKSVINTGTTFSVYIPTDLAMEKEPDIEEEKEAYTEKEEMNTADSGKKILIVEDNSEFRAYLKNELSRYFIVYEASDGEEGEKEALDKEPDIVITDLMMPKVNGFELCHRIKNNIKISHIPVILLTASSNIENEKTGYLEGADAYISKPFNWDILLTRIQNLIKQGTQRQQNFKKDIEATPKSITISSLDEKLMEKAINLIETNICNSEYSVEDLSSDMAMSRVNLFRKIRSITGMPPSEFIKSIRLKRAAKLLSQGELNVVEVAYSVGFNTPSYFTKSFKKMFGVLPTEYNTSLKEQQVEEGD